VRDPQRDRGIAAFVEHHQLVGGVADVSAVEAQGCPTLEVDVLARDRLDRGELLRERLEHPHPDRHRLSTNEDGAPLGGERLKATQDALDLVVWQRRLDDHSAGRGGATR
jgi:hypothetical protein